MDENFDNRPMIPQGWLRALVYLIFYFVFNAVFSAFAIETARSFSPKNWGESDYMLFALAVDLLPLLLLTHIFRKYIDRKTLGSLGFRWQGHAGDALLGFVSGVLVIAVGTFLLWKGGYLHFTGARFLPGPFFTALLLMILVSFGEELVVRGYILQNLMDSFPRWTALLVSSFLFAALHLLNPNMTLLSFTDLFVGGVFLGINYIYTKNLWFGWMLHFSWNYFQGPVLGYEVSGLDMPGILQQRIQGPDWITGGAFGFEGSVISTSLQIVAIALLTWYYERRKSRGQKNTWPVQGTSRPGML
jgi:uncharacterized protein